MDKFELQKLRDLPIEGVAERLGLHVVRHKALCPFHDDHHASLSFKVSKNTFRCFVCGASGGTIDMVMKYLNKDFKEAIEWLNPLQTSPRGGFMSFSLGGDGGGSSPRTFDATRYERFFERPWLNEEARRFLFEERRLDERVVRWCRLTSWKDREGTPWLQIPYYDREGRLVGVQNRNLTPSKPTTPSKPPRMTPSKPPRGEAFHSPSGEMEGGHSGEMEGGHSGEMEGGHSGEPEGGLSPRFRFPAGSQCGIYNLPVLNRLKPGDDLYITEGCSDCWAMLSAGHKAIAIPSATLLTKKDKDLLSQLLPSGRSGGGYSFHMYPDRDEPGERLFLQLKQVLPGLVHHQLPPGCKDFSEYYSSFASSTCK